MNMPRPTVQDTMETMHLQILGSYTKKVILGYAFMIIMFPFNNSA